MIFKFNEQLETREYENEEDGTYRVVTFWNRRLSCGDLSIGWRVMPGRQDLDVPMLMEAGAALMDAVLEESVQIGK